MHKALIISDLHLTSSTEDEYRWRVLDWAAEQRQTQDAADFLYILGDVAHRKDEHPATLVNRFTNKIDELLSAGYEQIGILAGNHDYKEHGVPYFKFLRYFGNKIKFIYEPEYHHGALWLPHSPRPLETLEHGVVQAHANKIPYVFMHHSVIGAVSSEFNEMDTGFTTAQLKEMFPKAYEIFSGHIHLPQKVPPVVYIGVPHPIVSGDIADYRAILLERPDHLSKGTWKSIPTNSFKKWSIKFALDANWPAAVERLSFGAPGDWASVTVFLTEDVLGMWGDIAKAITHKLEEQQIIVAAITNKRQKSATAVGYNADSEENLQIDVHPHGVFNNYLKDKEIPQIVQDMGRSILTQELA